MPDPLIRARPQASKRYSAARFRARDPRARGVAVDRTGVRARPRPGVRVPPKAFLGGPDHRAAHMLDKPVVSPVTRRRAHPSGTPAGRAKPPEGLPSQELGELEDLRRRNKFGWLGRAMRSIARPLSDVSRLNGVLLKWPFDQVRKLIPAAAVVNAKVLQSAGIEKATPENVATVMRAGTGLTEGVLRGFQEAPLTAIGVAGQAAKNIATGKMLESPQSAIYTLLQPVFGTVMTLGSPLAYGFKGLSDGMASGPSRKLNADERSRLEGLFPQKDIEAMRVWDRDGTAGCRAPLVARWMEGYYFTLGHEVYNGPVGASTQHEHIHTQQARERVTIASFLADYLAHGASAWIIHGERKAAWNLNPIELEAVKIDGHDPRKLREKKEVFSPTL